MNSNPETISSNATVTYSPSPASPHRTEQPRSPSTTSPSPAPTTTTPPPSTPSSTTAKNYLIWLRIRRLITSLLETRRVGDISGLAKLVKMYFRQIGIPPKSCIMFPMF